MASTIKTPFLKDLMNSLEEFYNENSMNSNIKVFSKDLRKIVSNIFSFRTYLICFRMF